MNILENLEYLKEQIETVTTVSDVLLCPPEISYYLVDKRNFPCVNIWDNGYSPITENTSLQGRLRRYTINVSVFVKNQQSEMLSNAYRELLTVENAISTVINDLSATGGTGEFTLKSQSSSGVRPIQQKDANYYVLARVTTFVIDVVEV